MDAGSFSKRRNYLVAWTAGILALALLGATLGLWARHGAAVFFDLVSAGFAYCF